MAIERKVEDGWVAVQVTDNGPGMTAEESRQAFEPFYTTKPPGKGTGLGLAVSYRLVEVQGGRIRIDSTPGDGTTVSVAFPISAESDEPAGAAAGRQTPPTTRAGGEDAANHSDC